MSDLQDAVRNLEMCRLCLSLAVVKINIFTDDFAKMIEILTSLKIRPNDTLPQNSCLKCARDVKMAFLVRRRIIQSHRVLVNKLNRSRRLSVASTSVDFNGLNPTVNADMPLQQLQNITGSTTPNVEGNMTVATQEVKNDDDSGSETDCNNDSPSNGENRPDVELKREDLNQETAPIDLDANILSDRSERIQNLKLAINTKYSDMIKSCKQKIHQWKLMNKKDQLNIIRWMEKKNNNTTINPPIQPKKTREPMKMYCNTCQLKFTNRITYRNHMTRHKHKICPVCNKQIRSAYLKKHITIHEDSPAMCEVCGITCKNPVSLKMHSFYYHKSNLSVCEDCGRSFKTKTKLLYHQRKDHTKERNYKCETCGKCFFAKIYLTKHINMKHMKMRPHICEYCGKGFSGKHALRTHIRQHTNEAPFHCNFCGERFRQRVSLRGHLKSRHRIEEENKVFCDTCGKGFTTSVALDVHIRLHKEIKCLWCSDTFAEKSYLEQHIILVHSKVEYLEHDVEAN